MTRVFCVCVLFLKPWWLYLKKSKNSRGDKRHQRKSLKINWNLKQNPAFVFQGFINATLQEDPKKWEKVMSSSKIQQVGKIKTKQNKTKCSRRRSWLAPSFTWVPKYLVSWFFIIWLICILPKMLRTMWEASINKTSSFCVIHVWFSAVRIPL